MGCRSARPPRGHERPIEFCPTPPDVHKHARSQAFCRRPSPRMARSLRHLASAGARPPVERRGSTGVGPSSLTTTPSSSGAASPAPLEQRSDRKPVHRVKVHHSEQSSSTSSTRSGTPSSSTTSSPLPHHTGPWPAKPLPDAPEECIIFRRVAEASSSQRLKRRQNVGLPEEAAASDSMQEHLGHGLDKARRRVPPVALRVESEPLRSCLRKEDRAPHSAPEFRQRVSFGERIVVEVTPRASKGTPLGLAKFFDCHDGFLHSLKSDEDRETSKRSEADVLREALFEQPDELDGATTDVDEDDSDSQGDTTDSEEIREALEVEEEEVDMSELSDEDDTSLVSCSLDSTWVPHKPLAAGGQSNLGATWRRPSNGRRPQPVSTKSCWYERTPAQH